MKNPGSAAVLSVLIPGVGQIYNGDFLRGIFWLIITPGFWIGSGGTLGWVCHVIASWTAYRARRRTWIFMKGGGNCSPAWPTTDCTDGRYLIVFVS
jgi:hypothetical protein